MITPGLCREGRYPIRRSGLPVSFVMDTAALSRITVPAGCPCADGSPRICLGSLSADRVTLSRQEGYGDGPCRVADLSTWPCT
ncbi:hypothetical protein R1flu_003050 [Riccia fluitans]|uniref:Uncharacterized protein n=1 Tax=Riccia fluitans TaxID=41844 RepID=A0ABD1Y7W4_9MARC